MMKTINGKQDQLDAETTKLSPSVRWALAGLSLSMLMPSLDTSIANAGLPTLEKAFDASFAEVQWIVLSYLLAITTLIVSVGRLGDIVGRRRLLLGGIGLFTLASFWCGAAPTLWLLIAGRAVQGIGAAIMMALTVALVTETVPKVKTGFAMGILGTMSAIGTTLGPSLGGIMIAGLGWSTIFFINIPLGILNFFLVYCFLPADHPIAKAERPKFDSAGTLVLALMLGAYALAMTTGHGQPSGILLLTALLGAVLFVFVESRAASPLIRLQMFRDPVLSASLTTSMIVATVMMATLVVGPFYLSRGLGLETAFVGLALSVGPLVAALAGVPAGRVVDRFGARRVSIVGLSGIAFGTLVLSLMPSAFGVPGYLAPITIITGSYALFQAGNNTMIMTDIRPDGRGVISGMLSLSRNLGLITGASVMGAVFAGAAGTSEVMAAEAEVVGAAMRITFAVSTGLIGVAIAAALGSRYLRRRSPLKAGDAYAAANY